VVSYEIMPLYPWRKIPRYTLARRLGGPQSDLNGVEKRKIFHCPESNLDSPAHSLSIFRLNYPDSS
jgi:hypothetical protein